jgi:hypothetical protein
MSDYREKILRAAELVERGWCRGAYARDGNGRVVIARSEDACQWCVGGAILATFGVCYWVDLPNDFRDQVSPPFDWNDAPGRTQELAAAKLREIAERFAR